MATLTKEQYEQLKAQGKKNFIPSGTGEQTIIEADKFVGALQGNADTATRLRDPITISLGGDAEGSTQFAGSSFRLDATIRNSEHADNADTAENAKHSAQASHADLANIATLALRCMLANNATHADRASNADNADHSDDATHADSADSASRATYDSNGDNIHNTFVNKQQQITSNTNLLSSHTTTIADHERRITSNKNKIEDLDTRVGDIETSTDVGKITRRIVNIEAKNEEQDGRLDAINDTMVTLSTSQYITGTKTFNKDIVFGATGLRIRRNDTDKYLIFEAGNSSDTSSSITISGTTRPNNEGVISFTARDSNNNYSSVSLKPDGTFLWNGNSLKSLMSNYSMPSSAYSSLTVGASGSSYTAPDDGYVCMVANNKNGGEASLLELKNTTNNLESRCLTSFVGFELSVLLPVCKGQSYSIKYSNVYNLALYYVHTVGALA